MPAPIEVKDLDNKSVREGGSSQNLMLFIRGNAMSGAESIRGTNQFPNPPIIIGITMKKIMIKACAVTIVLYTWSLNISLPGWPNSKRISLLRLAPTIPDHAPKAKYNVPMSL